MIKILEAYQPEMPDWIRDGLRELRRSYGDTRSLSWLTGLGDVTEFHEYPVPKSNRDKNLHDPNKINFFLYKGQLGVYDGYGRWYSNVQEPRTWRDLVNGTTKYAWISKEDSMDKVKNKRSKRAEIKAGALALQRTMNDWYGNKDKSGYIVDPYKYRKILSTKKLDVYQGYLEEANKLISECKDVINSFINNLDLDNYHHNLFTVRDKEGIFRILENMLSYASTINRAVKNVINGKPADEYGRNLDYIDKCVDRIKECHDKILKLLK